MNTEIAKNNGNGHLAAAVEAALMQGNLGLLSVQQRGEYYNQVCKSVGLNPFTQPFNYIVLNNKLTLYAKKDCTEQLRNIHGVSIEIVNRERIDDVYFVTARARNKDGRTDESIGAVSVLGLKAIDYANALMKAETKAKRRVTLSICGLGFLDESETETVKAAQIVDETWQPDARLQAMEEMTQFEEPERPAIVTTIKPLDNPWLFKLTRNKGTKYLFEVHDSKPEWFIGIENRFRRGSMSEEEYVNCTAAIDNLWQKEEARQKVKEESDEQ